MEGGDIVNLRRKTDLLISQKPAPSLRRTVENDRILDQLIVR